MPRSPRSETRSLLPRIGSWELWKTPRAMLGYVLAVEAVVGIAALVSPVLDHIGRTDLLRAGLIALLAIGFEELSVRISKLRSRLVVDSHVDMSSVWTFAAAVVLPSGLMAPLAIVVMGNAWLRHHRTAGYRAYRTTFATAVIVAAGMVARGMLLLVSGRLDGWPAGIVPVAALCLALVTYMAVNAALLHAAIYLAVRPENLRDIIGSWADVSLEFATLCLGGLTALAVLREPLLAALVVPPMFVLQRSVLTRQLEIAATTDAKTGLLNAATWHQVAAIELVRAEREGYGAALLIIDMDNFKVINDTYGHLAGDDVLKAVADALAEELRGYDSIGRFGGEEFVAVLSEVDELTALMISERIRQRISLLEVAARMDGEPALADLSCSIGVACYPTHGTDTETLLHAADAALYAAKRGGRNRVEVSVG